MNDLDQIDRELAEKVMGWKWFYSIKKWEPFPGALMKESIAGKDWYPTRSISQAFQVVERMRELGFNFLLERHKRYQVYFAVFWINSNGEGIDRKTRKSFDTTHSAAISMAALKAYDKENTNET